MLSKYRFPNERVTLLPFISACAAATIACGADQGVDPRYTPVIDTPVIYTPVITNVVVTPAAAAMEPGDTVALSVYAADQRGVMVGPLSVIYSSNAPAIAGVNSGGMVTAIATGTAEISATVTVGNSIRSAVMTATVSVPDSHVVVRAGVNGWQPAVARVIAGGVVEWITGPLSWAGTPNTRLWLLDEDYAVLDSVDLSSGRATRRFDARGTFRYCSGGCFDPPDFGDIIVR